MMVTRRDTERGEVTIVRLGSYVLIEWWDRWRQKKFALEIPVADAPTLVRAMVADGLVTEETYANTIT